VAWGRDRGASIRSDARLTLAARSGVRTGGVELSALRTTAQRAGWTDGELALIRVELAAGDVLETLLRRELDARLAGRDVNRVGVGSDGGAVLVLLSRQLVRLLPVPQRVHAGVAVTFAGTVPAGVIDLTLVLAGPDAAVRRLALPLREGSFALPVQLGGARGVVEAQVLADRGKGPEVAATLPIGIDAPPWREVAAPEVPAGDDPLGAIAAFVLGARGSLGLSLPAESAALSEVAGAHAADMRDHGFFAHASPSTGDLVDRLRGRGVAYGRALENIGSGADVEEILREWVASASHRGNLLDPEITSFGVGVAEAPQGGKVFAVLVLVR
jgi:hypothetical protein